MAPPSEWLKPPRSLLFALFLVTLVAVSALAWFGWRLLRQEQIVEAQRAQERLEQSADRIAATTREALAETGERLGNWAISTPADIRPDEGVLLILNGAALSAVPANRLLFSPTPSDGSEAPADTFADGEVLEFQQREPSRALDWYRKLADSKSPAIKAGALMCLARAFRKSGHPEEARAAYTQLATQSGTRIAGVPAELAARHALCELSQSKSEAAP
jgi:hypothetical protein